MLPTFHAQPARGFDSPELPNYAYRGEDRLLADSGGRYQDGQITCPPGVCELLLLTGAWLEERLGGREYAKRAIPVQALDGLAQPLLSIQYVFRGSKIFIHARQGNKRSVATAAQLATGFHWRGYFWHRP